MNNLPREKLVEIVRRHGREIAAAPRRCEGLMRDNFPAHRREIAVLTSALEERIPSDLLSAGTSQTPRNALFNRLAARLRDDVAMEETAARWAVRTWALALALITPNELDALERADAQAHAAAQPTMPATPAASREPRATAAAPDARATLVVAFDGSGDFLTLTEAVRRARAGTLLLVRPGVYEEGLVVDKEIEIVGDGPREEIIVRATTSSCLLLRADAAKIRNLTLRGQARTGGPTGRGFFAVDIPHGRPLVDGCDISSDSLACVAIHNPTAAPVLRGCHIHHGVDSGAYAFGSAQGVIEACDFAENAGVGIVITGGATTKVKDCRVHDGGDAGIVVWDRAASTVEGCEVYANRRASVSVGDAGVVSLRGCRIHDGGNTGVFTQRDGQTTVEGCNIHGHAAPEVAVTGGGTVQLRDCQIHDGQSHGVFVHDAGRALLESCDVFRNRESGVHVDANGVGVARSCRINDNGSVGVSCDAGGAIEVESCDLTENRVSAWQAEHGASVTGGNNRL